MTRRCFGLDVHREFAQVAIWQDGRVRQAGQIATTPEGLRVFADSLGAERRGRAGGDVQHARDRQAAGGPRSRGWWSPTRRRPGRSPRRRSRPTRSTPRCWPQLLAADYLPSVWVADEAHAGAASPGRAARAHRAPAHPVEEPGAGDPASQPGPALPGRRPVRASRAAAGWPSRRCPPTSARPSRRCCASWTSTARSCGSSTPSSAASRWAAPEVKRLMTIPGVDATVALSIVAAVGDFARFRIAGQARQLPRAEPARQAVRRPARRARADHQAGPRARARDARRGRLGGVQDARPAAGVLSARPRAPRDADRRRGDRPQARRAVLAPDHQAARTTPSRARR